MRMAARLRAACACSSVAPSSDFSSSADLCRADLLELVDAPQHPGGVRQADAAVEAFRKFAVVDAQAEVGNRQGAQCLGDHQCNFDVVTERQVAVADDVDVRLGELAGTAFLRTLAAPHLLDLVTAEREREVAGVLDHIARERHCQVEVQRQGVVVALGCPGFLFVLLQAAESVHLFVDLTLAEQLADGFHCAGFDRGEAVQLEDTPQGVQHMQLHQPLLGKPLGESGQGGGACHGGFSPQVTEGWSPLRSHPLPPCDSKSGGQIGGSPASHA